jgi:hypothetical protein
MALVGKQRFNASSSDKRYRLAFRLALSEGNPLAMPEVEVALV